MMAKYDDDDADKIIIPDEVEEGGCSECYNEDVYPLYLTSQNKKKKIRCRMCNKLKLSRRLVRKNGDASVRRTKRSLLALIYVHDLANTLINCNWKWTLTALSSAFVFTWVLFALLWMMVSANNGDLEDAKNGTLSSTPCLSGIQGFAGYLMFSIETQSTIGYGNRYISHHCPEAVLLLCVQIAAGTCVCGLLISIVFEKISGPKKISSKTSFSKHATICQRDGELCMVFRVRDCDRRYQCHNEIKAYLVQNRGDELFLKSIKLESIGFLMWPVDIVHRITASSPFWDLSARDLIIKRFEMIVFMEGTSLTTSNPSSTKTSYLSGEILWGHIFQPCVKYDKNKNVYVVNNKLFNRTTEVTMPLCSAKRLQEVLQEMVSFNGYDFSSSNSPWSDSIKGSKNDENGQDSSTVSPMTVSPVTVHVSSFNGSDKNNDIEDYVEDVSTSEQESSVVLKVENETENIDSEKEKNIARVAEPEIGTTVDEMNDKNKEAIGIKKDPLKEDKIIGLLTSLQEFLKVDVEDYVDNVYTEQENSVVLKVENETGNIDLGKKDMARVTDEPKIENTAVKKIYEKNKEAIGKKEDPFKEDKINGVLASLQEFLEEDFKRDENRNYCETSF